MAVNKPVADDARRALSVSGLSSKQKWKAKPTGPSEARRPGGSWIRKRAPRQSPSRECAGKRPNNSKFANSYPSFLIRLRVPRGCDINPASFANGQARAVRKGGGPFGRLSGERFHVAATELPMIRLGWP